MTNNASLPEAKRPTIFILDDEPQLARLLEMGVHDWFKNPEVVVFADGNAAWHELSRRSPDMFIMDWSHPGMDGHALLEKLTVKPAGFVILLTSELFAEQFGELTGKGLKIGYLPKPFGIQQFWRALNDFVGPSDFPNRQGMVGGG